MALHIQRDDRIVARHRHVRAGQRVGRGQHVLAQARDLDPAGYEPNLEACETAGEGHLELDLGWRTIERTTYMEEPVVIMAIEPAARARLS